MIDRLEDMITKVTLIPICIPVIFLILPGFIVPISGCADETGIVYSNFTCESFIGNFTTYCYTDIVGNYSERCCQSCAKVKVCTPGCEYGNRALDCEAPDCARKTFLQRLLCCLKCPTQPTVLCSTTTQQTTPTTLPSSTTTTLTTTSPTTTAATATTATTAIATTTTDGTIVISPGLYAVIAIIGLLMLGTPCMFCLYFLMKSKKRMKRKVRTVKQAPDHLRCVTTTPD